MTSQKPLQLAEKPSTEIKRMNDFLENMWNLEQEKLAQWQKFQQLPTKQQITYLNQKLDWEHYKKLKTDFFLEILDTHHLSDEILTAIWKNWLKTSILQEFRRRDGIVFFFNRNPHLKHQMIAELNYIIAHTPENTPNSTIPDESGIYNAILILWDLGYKQALQDFIKTHQKNCDLYLDEEDYLKIKELEENN